MARRKGPTGVWERGVHPEVPQERKRPRRLRRRRKTMINRVLRVSADGAHEFFDLPESQSLTDGQGLPSCISRRTGEHWPASQQTETG